MHFNDINPYTHMVRLGEYLPILIKLIPKVTKWGMVIRDSSYLIILFLKLYMSKLISKIINSKTMFGPECYYFKSIFREAINNGFISLYNIMRIDHQLLVNYSVECHIPSQKKAMYFSDNVDNIMIYIEREVPRDRQFTKFQQFDIAIIIITTFYKNYFMVKANNYFQSEHDMVNNKPFELGIHKIGTTCGMWGKYQLLNIPNHIVQDVHMW